MNRIPFWGISRTMRACGLAVSVVALLKFLLDSVLLPFANELHGKGSRVELGQTAYMFEDIWLMLLGGLLLAIAEGSLLLAQYLAGRKGVSASAEKSKV
jgi:hypothetical protein